MTGIVRTLTARDALVGAWCMQCQGPFRVGERVVVKPRAPARHEECPNEEVADASN
jgi:hypothetical protein